MPWGQHYGVSPDLVTQEVTGLLVSLLEADTSAAAMKTWTAKLLIVHSVLSLLFGLLGATVFSLFASRDMASEA
jgi:type III secretory pathway component EscS